MLKFDIVTGDTEWHDPCLCSFGITEAIGAVLAGVVGSAALGTGIAGGIAGLGIAGGAADAIAGVAAPALLGAGVGAAGSAITGGNPLTGALTGGLSGGLIGGLGGATGALTSALGGSAPIADAVLGAGAGAVGSAVTKGNPLTGALEGGAGGALTGLLSGSMAGVEQGNWDATGGTGGATTAANNATLSSNNPSPVYGSGTSPTVDNTSTLNPDTTGTVNPQSAQAAATSGSGGGMSNFLSKNSPALMLGALAAASSLFNKPAQGGYALPTATSASGNSAYQNTPLPAAGTFPGATPLNPSVPNYYTYGQIPGGANYFANNNLSAYGFARGGAMSQVANENEREFRTGSGNHRVRGPGTETSDSIEARLSNNEYVMDAEDMRRIGHGSPERGAKILDRQRKQLNQGKGALTQLASVA